jgi:hypothetical protein
MLFFTNIIYLSYQVGFRGLGMMTFDSIFIKSCLQDGHDKITSLLPFKNSVSPGFQSIIFRAHLKYFCFFVSLKNAPGFRSNTEISNVSISKR